MDSRQKGVCVDGATQRLRVLSTMRDLTMYAAGRQQARVHIHWQG